MKKLTDQEALAIIQQAQDAAAQAAHDYLMQIGGDNYPCGFSWVKIRPARGQFVRLLKELKLGRTDDYEGGFLVYNPSKNNCQNMDAKYAGSCAFAEVLRQHGVKANPVQRID